MGISIIHISDLHVDKTIDFFNEKIREISKKIADLSSNEVLILFSGDLTKSGQSSQFNYASSFIKQIKASTSKKVFVACCPGNHDRCFGEGETFLNENILSINSESFREAFKKFSYLNRNYYLFENNFESCEKINDVLSVYNFKIDKKLIKVFSLNNSLLTHFNPNGKELSDTCNFEKIFIPRDLFNIERNNAYLCILIMHMPLNFMDSRTKKHLTDICNKNVDLIIDGHIHENCILKDCGDKKFIEFTSPALAANETSGYTFFEVEDDKIDYYTYSFSDETRTYKLTNNCKNQFVKFNRKICTFNNLSINRDFVDQDTIFKTTNDVEIKINDSFVFPLLSTKKYSNSKRYHILKSQQFIEFISKYQAIQISSESGMGKSTLANRLFHILIDYDFMPVLCSGFDFAGYQKNKDKIKTYLSNQIKNCYDDSEAISTFKDAKYIGKRVIIVDDFDTYTEDIIYDILKYFDQVIFFVDNKVKGLITYTSLGTIHSCKVEIEAFYKYKRQELFEKIFKIISKNHDDVEDVFNKDTYLTNFETCLMKFDKNNTLDPWSLIELATKVILDSKNLANVSNFHYQVYYYDHAIEDKVKSNDFKKCSITVANRIIEYVAYKCYKDEMNSFSVALFKESLEEEDNQYGGDNFTDYLKFANILCEARILKKKEKEENMFSFYKRKVFAYFVGRYAIRILHSFNDSSLMDLIIQRGIYSPINFNILMSIASNYSYDTIPNYFVRDLYDQIMSVDIQLMDSIGSIKNYFDEDKQRLLDLSKEEKQSIKKTISKQEEKERNEYLENADNYFYVETMTEQVKEIVDLYNKMTIVSSLLCSSDLIRKNEKKKLAELVIKLPNVIIDKFISFIKVDLDKIYVEMQEEAEKSKSFDKTFIDEFFDFLTALIISFILGTYDTSVRFLGSANVSKEMDEQLKNTGNEVMKNMYSIQKLMLLSYTNKSVFAEETLNFIEKKGKKDKRNKFYLNQAILIAKRFYFDNEEYVNKHQKALLNQLGGYAKLKIEEVKNRKIKR